MANRKTMTRQTLIGEKGIELITRRCLQMGYLFHPRRVDHGIDGHIDLVEAETGAVLNLTLLVQSKTQDRPFQGENADAFRHLCDQRDLDIRLLPSRLAADAVSPPGPGVVLRTGAGLLLHL